MWKLINEHPNYEVSDMGQVRNITTGRILKDRINTRGYTVVYLSTNGKVKTKRLHRLVAEAFIPNPNGKEQVNHIDADKRNNEVSNLEWTSRHENYAHAVKLGLSKSSIGVVQYTLEGEYINEYESLTKAANSVRGKTCSIKLVCEGVRKQHKNYVWRYKDAH